MKHKTVSLNNDDIVKLDSYSASAELELEAFDTNDDEYGFSFVTSRVEAFPELALRFNKSDVVIRVINKSTNKDLSYKTATFVLGLHPGDDPMDIIVNIPYWDIDGASYDGYLEKIKNFMFVAQREYNVITKLLKICMDMEQDKEPDHEDSVMCHVCVNEICNRILNHEEKEATDGK